MSSAKTLGGSGSQSVTMLPKAGATAAGSAGQVTIISKPPVATPKPTIRINTGPGGSLYTLGWVELGWVD